MATLFSCLPGHQNQKVKVHAFKSFRFESLVFEFTLVEMFHHISICSKLITPLCFVVPADDSDLSGDGSCGSYTESGVDPMVSSVRAFHVFLISHGGTLDLCRVFDHENFIFWSIQEMPDSLTTFSGDLNHLRREFAAYG